MHWPSAAGPVFCIRGRAHVPVPRFACSSALSKTACHCRPTYTPVHVKKPDRDRADPLKQRRCEAPWHRRSILYVALRCIAAHRKTTSRLTSQGMRRALSTLTYCNCKRYCEALAGVTIRTLLHRSLAIARRKHSSVVNHLHTVACSLSAGSIAIT